MFILRKVRNGEQSNYMLGASYKIEAKSPTNNLIERSQGMGLQDESIKMLKALVVNEKGTDMMPVYENEDAYIMCSDGKTFDRINRID